MTYEFGEGALRMNKATNYLILAARRAQKIWNLSTPTIIECLERAAAAENHGKLMSHRDTAHAINPKEHIE